jgi:hypothetical protein
MSEETATPPQIKISWLILTMAAFAIFAAIGGYSARMTQDYTDYDQDRAAKRYANLTQTRDAEDKLIHPIGGDKKPTAEWVDQDKGLIRIPIEEAMAKEIDTLKAQPAAAGCEIPGAVPAPAAAPAAPATPPSAGAPSTNAAPTAPAAPVKPGAKPSTAKAKATATAAPAKPKT